MPKVYTDIVTENIYTAVIFSPYSATDVVLHSPTTLPCETTNATLADARYESRYLWRASIKIKRES